MYRELAALILGGAMVVAILPPPGAAFASEQLGTVSFPSLGRSAALEAIGVVDGQLGVPADPDDVGVYQLQGNLLMVGHVDWAGKLRLFAEVKSFQGGEPIVLSDGRSYHVTWVKRWSIDNDASQWADVVASDDDELTLITCTGVFDRARGLYLDRVAIRAERDQVDAP